MRDLRLHDHTHGVRFPWPPKVRFELRHGAFKLHGSVEQGVLKRQTRELVGIGSPLCCKRVLLPEDRALLGDDVARLEGGVGVAEDEVDRALDGALAVVLAEGVAVEGVLVAVEGHFVHGDHVGGATEGDGLVAVGAGRVLHFEGLADEVLALHNWKQEEKQSQSISRPTSFAEKSFERDYQVTIKCSKRRPCIDLRF